jgi:hypothetical protein
VLGAGSPHPRPDEPGARPHPAGDTGADVTINLGGYLTLRPHRWPRLPLPRKEVIQPHLPVRLPCYDFVPVTNPTFDGCLLAVGPPASGVVGFHDVTGGVYKAREHIHRRMLTGGY